MFITKEQMEKRINSSNNVINVIKQNISISNPTAKVGVQDNIPVIQENLPQENNQERAARNARNNIDYSELHEEYTVNPNIGNDTVRATIGALSATGVSSQTLQKEFGVTKNQIIGARNSKPLKERIDNTKDKVSELALDKLMSVLNLLDTDSIANEKPKEIANIAVSMAKVVGSMRKHDQEKDNKITLTVITPMQRNIESYNTIDV